MSLVGINFPVGMVNQDLKALFKRSHMVVFGRNFAYHRSPGADEHEARAIHYPLGERDLLAPACKERMNRYK